MNAEIKQQWTQALRSGTYQQVCGSLHDDVGFCVIGVLCDLHRQWMGGEWKKLRPGMRWYAYEGQSGHLPTCVREWASISIDDYIGGVMLRNDAGKPFDQLADYIDANL